MIADRVLACIVAVACVYGAVAAIWFGKLVFVGPLAAGFVLAIVAAQMGEPFWSGETNVFMRRDQRAEKAEG